jgi:hypothetical protein
MKKNANIPVARCSLGDPDNIALQNFMKQNKGIVQKIWDKIQAKELQLNTEANEDVARSIVTINEPEFKDVSEFFFDNLASLT